MKKKLLFVLLLLFEFSAFAIEECPDKKAPIGKIKIIYGSATIIRQNPEKSFIAQKDLIVCLKDFLKTEKKSYVSVLFDDNSSDILIYPESEFRVDQYLLKLKDEKNKNNEKEEATFDGIKGKMKFFFDNKKHNPDSLNVKFKTPNGVMAVRGTVGLVTATAVETRLVVESGTVALSNIADPSKEISVTKGYWGAVKGTKPPAPPQLVTPGLWKQVEKEFALPKGGFGDLSTPKDTPPTVSSLSLSAPQLLAGDKKDEKEKPLLADKKDDKDSPRQWRVGPTISLGFLRLVNFGIEAKVWDWLSIGAFIGGIPETKIPDSTTSKAEKGLAAKLSYINYEFRGLVFPFRGSFFIGCGFGYEKFKIFASKTEKTPSSSIPPDFEYTLSAVGQIDRYYLSPQFGWMAVWKSGILLGTEFGATVSMQPSNSLTLSVSSDLVPAADKTKAENDLKNSLGLDKIQKYPLPFWNIIKIGYLF